MTARWVTVGEVARRLHLSVPTARKRLRAGEVPGLVAHFGTPRVERQVFEKWLLSKDR